MKTADLTNFPPGITRLLTLQQIMAASNQSKSAIYNAIARGELKTVKLGRSLRFRCDDYERWLDSLSGTSGKP